MPNCSVPYCANSSGKDSRLTFHEFPHETPVFLKKWIENIGRPNWRPGVRSVVCSEHFVKDDFTRQGRLHIGSFPSKFPDSPFRKKKKVGSNHVNNTEAFVVQNTKSDTCLKTSLPLEQKVQSANVDSKSHIAENKTPKTQKECLLADITKNESTSKKISAVNENAMNEDREVRIHCPSPLKGIVTSPKPSGGFGIPKKRKILEERQLALPEAAPLAAVTSSYSLIACRVCGETSNSNTNIFSLEAKGLGLSEMIDKCLPVQISESDSLPHYLCKTCISRLKMCYELFTSCERTNLAFRGESSELLGTKDGDPPIIYSKSTLTQFSSKSVSNQSQYKRVLLLEMPLTDQIPVKSMIKQAIKELSLRITPKESRETKPQSKIMLLDLQGGPEVFPEQMKKAVSMLFSSSSGDKVPDSIPHQPPGSAPKRGMEQVNSKSTHLNLESPTVGSIPITQRCTATKTSTSPTLQSNVALPLAAQTNVVVPIMNGVTSIGQSGIRSLAMNAPSTNAKPNLSTPKGPILTVLPNPGSSKGLCLTTLPGNLQMTTLPQLIQLPVNNLIKVDHKLNVPKLIATKPSASIPISSKPIPAKASSLKTTSTFETHPPVTPMATSSFNEDDDNLFEDSPPDIPDFPETPHGLDAVTEEKSKQTSSEVLVDFSKIKDKVITKINNSGKQLKLGDKIVGIVLRNSDSKEDIHKKLQATFSAAAPLKTAKTSSGKLKDRTSPLKGSVAIPVDTILTADAADGHKKLKEPLLDVSPAIDDLSSHFERRNARKLSLSFMWRKTGFLVSSYQKLFTWIMPSQDEDSVENNNPVLICRVCKFAAESKGEVETHLQAHPDLQCTVCSKYFLTVSKVQEHMGVIHNISSVLSEGSKKKTVFSWRQNVVRRDPLKHYQCSHCDKRFKAIDSLKRHAAVCRDRLFIEKETAAKKANLLLCTHSQCNRSFKTAEELEEHTSIHNKRTSWLCDICGLVLKSASNYRSHLGRHDELAHEYNYQCNDCKKRFKLLHRYEEHIKKHEIPRQYICSSCGKVFRNLSNLRQHEMLHGERKLQCRYCPSRFHRRDHLKIHESSHTRSQGDDSSYKPRIKKSKLGSAQQEQRLAAGPRSYTCRFCIASLETVVKFTNMRELMKHYNDDHSEERKNIIPGSKKFTCDRCNRSFANSTLLGHHLMWHAGISPYTCQFCGAGFMVKERLRNHEMTHTNERPYQCSTCDKGFRSRNALKQHKVLHKDPSEFLKCTYCDKTFSRPDNLRTHERVHTGEKPWKCRHCERPFRLRSECSKHVQIAHHVPLGQVSQYIDTLVNPLMKEESSSAESGIKSALAGIPSVQDMELLIEGEDLAVGSP